MTFHQACAAICEADRPNAYAKAYAKAGLAMQGAEAQRVQALYILNNITHWRGEQAREVRAALKEISK
jgi:hypothetical protein